MPDDPHRYFQILTFDIPAKVDDRQLRWTWCDWAWQSEFGWLFQDLRMYSILLKWTKSGPVELGKCACIMEAITLRSSKHVNCKWIPSGNRSAMDPTWCDGNTPPPSSNSGYLYINCVFCISEEDGINSQILKNWDCRAHSCETRPQLCVVYLTWQWDLNRTDAIARKRWRNLHGQNCLCNGPTLK